MGRKKLKNDVIHKYIDKFNAVHTPIVDKMHNSAKFVILFSLKKIIFFQKQQ